MPTLCMTSAYSITRSVNPPRAAFLDFPLGHTTGKPGEPELQREILERALAAFDAERPGEILELPYHWAETDDWKTGGGGESAAIDDRSPRTPVPDYQTEADRLKAEAALAAGGCPGCVWLD